MSKSILHDMCSVIKDSLYGLCIIGVFVVGIITIVLALIGIVWPSLILFFIIISLMFGDD